MNLIWLLRDATLWKGHFGLIAHPTSETFLIFLIVFCLLLYSCAFLVCENIPGNKLDLESDKREVLLNRFLFNCLL